MLEPDNWRLRQFEQLRRLQPAMSRHNPVRLIDQNWSVKPECFNATGYRTDLVLRVLSRIAWIRKDGPDGQIGDDRSPGDELRLLSTS